MSSSKQLNLTPVHPPCTTNDNFSFKSSLLVDTIRRFSLKDDQNIQKEIEKLDKQIEEKMKIVGDITRRLKDATEENNYLNNTILELVEGKIMGFDHPFSDDDMNDLSTKASSEHLPSLVLGEKISFVNTTMDVAEEL